MATSPFIGPALLAQDRGPPALPGTSQAGSPFRFWRKLADHADHTLRGKPIKVRFVWSHITATTAQWEQAYSGDGGKTWETNWVQQLRRVK